MMPAFALPADDVSLARLTAGGDHTAFEQLMRRHNTRLFRTARAVLRDDAEAEDALQEAYLEAYQHIREFRGDASLSTWLTRIVVNRALMRLRSTKRHRRVVPIDAHHGKDSREMPGDVADSNAESPHDAAARSEMRKMIERRIDELPLGFRTVFVMREIEDLSVRETAECLSIPEATVRTRLFRARALMRDALARDIDVASADAFAFAGRRCDRVVAHVMARLRGTS